MTNKLSQRTYNVIEQHIQESEGVPGWPYLDSKGHVTIGAGFKIETEEEFLALPLAAPDGQPLSDEQKQNAWNALGEEKRKGNFGQNINADRFNGMTGALMPEQEIDTRLRDEIVSRVGRIQREVGDEAWDKLNDHQKAAIVDIAYANGDGDLKGFPKLKQAIKDGDAMAMAKESPFYADKEKGTRHKTRLQRNYEALSGLGEEESNKQLNALLKRLDQDDAPSGVAQRGGNPHTDEDAIRNLQNTLNQPGDNVDEAALKDDLTKQELDDLMRSKAYLSANDPRHKLAQGRVKEWYEDHYGNDPVTTDATGRFMAVEKPKIMISEKPEPPVDYITEKPLDDAVNKVTSAIADRARVSSPTHAVKMFQNLLNNQGVPDVRPLPLLKEDGIAGPKTRRALRFATQRMGADSLLSGFSRLFT